MDFEDDDEEGEAEKGPKFPICMYISEGNMHFRLRQYEKAITCFSTALESEPNNIKSLLARSRCYIRIAEYDRARLDAEEVLKLNPKSTPAASLKAEAEYLVGDFERGLVSYSKGHQLRPTNKELRYGLELCGKAIDNALGSDTKMTLSKADVDVMESILMTDTSSSSKYKRDHGRKRGPDILTRDVNYLRSLLDDKSLSRSTGNLSPSIVPTCERLLAFIEDRQKFWQMQRPIHARKKVVRSPTFQSDSKCVTLRAKDRGKASRIALEKGDISTCIAAAEQMLDIVKEIPDEILPQKILLKGFAYDMLGRAYMKKNELNTSMSYLEKEYNLSVEHDLLKLRARALSQMGENFMKREDYENGYKCFKDNILLLHTDAAKVTVLYNTVRCLIGMNNLEEAKSTAKSALSLVTFIGDKTRQIDFTMLLAEIERLEQNNDNAATDYETALELARQSKDERKQSIRSLLHDVDQDRRSSKVSRKSRISQSLPMQSILESDVSEEKIQDESEEQMQDGSEEQMQEGSEEQIQDASDSENLEEIVPGESNSDVVPDQKDTVSEEQSAEVISEEPNPTSNSTDSENVEE